MKCTFEARTVCFMFSISECSGSLCPHHNKSHHTSPAEPMALSATSATAGCPQCAAALSLTDGVGPVHSEASGEAEEGAVEETDREGEQSGGKEKSKEGRDGAGTRVGCSPKKSFKELWHGMRIKLWAIVESKYFNRGIMIAILINTISMGIEHHEQVRTAFGTLVVLHICLILGFPDVRLHFQI